MLSVESWSESFLQKKESDCLRSGALVCTLVDLDYL